jgi:hypothetical protein
MNPRGCDSVRGIFHINPAGRDSAGRNIFKRFKQAVIQRDFFFK